MGVESLVSARDASTKMQSQLYLAESGEQLTTIDYFRASSNLNLTIAAPFDSYPAAGRYHSHFTIGSVVQHCSDGSCA
jgi:hypothetical protein